MPYKRSPNLGVHFTIDATLTSGIFTSCTHRHFVVAGLRLGQHQRGRHSEPLRSGVGRQRALARQLRQQRFAGAEVAGRVLKRFARRLEAVEGAAVFGGAHCGLQRAAVEEHCAPLKGNRGLLRGFVREEGVVPREAQLGTLGRQHQPRGQLLQLRLVRQEGLQPLIASGGHRRRAVAHELQFLQVGQTVVCDVGAVFGAEVPQQR